MESHQIPETTPIPGVIKVLVKGCNTAANKAGLMLPPILLDLFLLFGPKFRIENYVQPFLDSLLRQIRMSAANIGTQQIELLNELMPEAVSSINLAGLMRTYPIGVSVLFSSGGNETPLGTAPVLQIGSALGILALTVLFLFLGVFLGSLYYSVTAAAARRIGAFSWKTFARQLANIILLYIALTVVIVILSVPFSCVMTLLFMAVPFLYQIMVIAAAVFACWLIVPFFYIPHGIFVRGWDLPEAIKSSVKMAGWSSPITIRFILLSLVISFGLDLIWTIPAQSSWLILISVFGHAYVTTATLASSFYLFIELDRWQNENRSYLEWRKANLRIRQILKKEPKTHD